MAYTFIASVAAGSTTGNNITTASVDMTGANFFVAAVSFTRPNDPSQVSDSVNGTTGWTLHDTDFVVGSAGVQIWSVDGVTGASQTFTATSSGGLPSIAVFGFSGADDPAFETPTSNNNTAATTTIQPGSITPDEDNELVFTGVGDFRDDGATINGGFSSPVDVFQVGGQHTGLSAAYLIQTTAAAANPTWTFPGGSSDAATIIANFQAAPGGAVRRFILVSPA